MVWGSIARGRRLPRSSLLLAVAALSIAASPVNAVVGWTGPNLFGPADNCRDVVAGLDANGKLHTAAWCGSTSRIRSTSNSGGPTVTTYFTHPAGMEDIWPEMAIDGNRVYVAFTRVGTGCAVESFGVFMRSRTLTGAWSTSTALTGASRYLASLRVVGGESTSSP